MVDRPRAPRERDDDEIADKYVYDDGDLVLLDIVPVTDGDEDDDETEDETE